jgi:hypothetical protein
MTRFTRRLVAEITALAFVPIAAVTVAAPGISSAECNPSVYSHCETSSPVPPCDKNWSRNVWTNECKPPPPIPEWFVPKPAYAPSYAPADIPPPPPPPPWAQVPGMQLHPVWDTGSRQWVWKGI